MLRSIILLCQPQERPYLAGILRLHNPGLTIIPAADGASLNAAVDSAPPGTRLIAFLTGVVVGADLLARLSGPSYNFHPGPPAYPGKYPLSFALYDGAPRFGATAHEMVAQVDSGPIVGAVEFDLPPQAGFAWGMERAHDASIRLFLMLAPRLATSPEPLAHVAASWGPRRCSQKAADALRTVSPDIPADELQRRLRAFGETGDMLPLRTVLHGQHFRLMPD